MVISANYGFSGSVMTVTNAKSSAESEKLNLKIRSESEKLLTIGCHFAPKSTNGTLLTPPLLDSHNLNFDVTKMNDMWQQPEAQ